MGKNYKKISKKIFNPKKHFFFLLKISNSLNFQKSTRKDAHVELLTAKRSQNVAIMLKQFKNIDELIDDVSQNKPVAEIDALQNLFGMLPQSEEVSENKWEIRI